MSYIYIPFAFYRNDCLITLQIDVAGTLQFWGVTIDTASSVLLILCFGLAVDYSAHVGHSFMTVLGTKNGKYQI